MPFNQAEASKDYLLKVSMNHEVQLLISSTNIVKLPAHRPALPGNVISFYILPLCPAYKAGLAGRVSVNLYCPPFNHFW
jgi:hypothetical protein